MSKQKEDELTKEKLTDHNYDGIQELDNALPGWWLATFYITIIFSVFYYGYYELGSGPTLTQEFEKEVEAIEIQKNAAPKSEFPNEEKLAAVMKATDYSAGKLVFQGKCVSCHGDKAQGIIGPNLTDDYWITGDGKPGAIAKTVHQGVPEKGMPPWSSLLSEEEIYTVVAYIKSLRGSNPAGAKAPQGNPIKE